MAQNNDKTYNSHITTDLSQIMMYEKAKKNAIKELSLKYMSENEEMCRQKQAKKDEEKHFDYLYQKNYEENIRKQDEQKVVNEIQRFEDNQNQEAANRQLLLDKLEEEKRYEAQLERCVRRQQEKQNKKDQDYEAKLKLQKQLTRDCLISQIQSKHNNRIQQKNQEDSYFNRVLQEDVKDYKNYRGYEKQQRLKMYKEHQNSLKAQIIDKYTSLDNNKDFLNLQDAFLLDRLQNERNELLSSIKQEE